MRKLITTGVFVAVSLTTFNNAYAQNITQCKAPMTERINTTDREQTYKALSIIGMQARSFEVVASLNNKNDTILFFPNSVSIVHNVNNLVKTPETDGSAIKMTETKPKHLDEAGAIERVIVSACEPKTVWAITSKKGLLYGVITDENKTQIKLFTVLVSVD
ncbi:MAG: hypothetical protein V1492_01440, partial [Candidatus Micrarchaeota archaeon]